MKLRIRDKFGIWNLKIPVAISVAFHFLLSFTAASLFSESMIHRSPVRFIKVTLYHWENEPNSLPESPLPIKPPLQKQEEKQIIQEQKQKETLFKEEIVPPVLLPVQAMEKPIPAEESIGLFSPRKDELIKDEFIGTEPATLTVVAGLNADVILTSEKNSSLLKEPLSKGENQSDPLTSSRQGVMQEENLSNTPTGKAGVGKEGSVWGGLWEGSGPGERFRREGFGRGVGMGQGVSDGGNSGSPLGTGTGSGYGDSRAGGSRKGTGIFAKLFSSSGGSGGIHPRYAENPKPPYPQEAREKGYQGEVLLRVEVLSNGRVGQIEIKRSSGHDILDQSALTAVKQWKFIPGKRGTDAVSSWVNIPIKFQLE